MVSIFYWISIYTMYTLYNYILWQYINSNFYLKANVSQSLSFFIILIIISWLTDHNLVASAESNAAFDGSQR